MVTTTLNTVRSHRVNGSQENRQGIVKQKHNASLLKNIDPSRIFYNYSNLPPEKITLKLFSLRSESICSDFTLYSSDGIKFQTHRFLIMKLLSYLKKQLIEQTQKLDKEEDKEKALEAFLEPIYKCFRSDLSINIEANKLEKLIAFCYGQEQDLSREDSFIQFIKKECGTEKISAYQFLKTNLHEMCQVSSESFLGTNFTDVTLLSHDNVEFVAHRALLYTCGEVFTKNIKPKQTDKDTFHINLDSKNLENIIYFIYDQKDKINLTKENTNVLFNFSKLVGWFDLTNWICQKENNQMITIKV